MMMMRVLCF